MYMIRQDEHGARDTLISADLREKIRIFQPPVRWRSLENTEPTEGEIINSLCVLCDLRGGNAFQLTGSKRVKSKRYPAIFFLKNMFVHRKT
jgi:hypothetical protein